MKKRFMAALSVLALALALPVAAFAADSPANVKSGPVTSNGVTANASGVAAGSDAWLKVVGTGTAAVNVPSGSNVVASFEVTQQNTSGPYNFTFALGSQYAGAKVTAYIQHDSGVREEKQLLADANGNVSFTMNELCTISLVAQPTSGASAATSGASAATSGASAAASTTVTADKGAKSPTTGVDTTGVAAVAVVAAAGAACAFVALRKNN